MEVYAGLPGAVVSQNVSLDPMMGVNGTVWIPPVYDTASTPIFRTETEQLDLLRLAMLLVGVLIGVKLLR